MLDTDFNYVIDGLRQLDIDIAGVEAGILPGSDDPANANFLPTTDGAGNISWVDISDENIRDASISGSKLLPQAITDRELGDGSANTSKLATNSVTTIKVLDFNITANKLAPDSVPTDKIVDLNVTAAKLAANSVPTEKIVDLNVTTSKIANANVTLAKLAQEVLDRLVPIGTVVEFAGSTGFAANWLECNGQAVSRATYATLFANLGTVYGVGDGATTFNLPDKRGRVPVGIGSDNNTGGRITAATAASITLGGAFGAETQTLDVTQIPSHNHSNWVMNTTFGAGFAGSGIASGGTQSGTTSSTGGGLPHPNVQPSIFTRYYIRAL
jgi:microcystin-dependent protein